MINRTRAVLTSSLAMGVAILSLCAVAPSAYAALSDCPARSACLWTAENYNGEISIVSGYSNYTDLKPAVHDNARSAASMTKNARMCIFDWRNGDRVTIGSLAPGQRVPKLLEGVGRAGPDAMGACAKASGAGIKAPQCVTGHYFEQYISSIAEGDSYVRVTWQPTLCQEGGTRKGDTPMLQEVGAGRILGIGVDFKAPHRTGSSVTYVGEVRQCISFGVGYSGVSFSGSGCYTIADVTLRAEVFGSSIRYTTSVRRVAEWVDRQLSWTPDMK